MSLRGTVFTTKKTILTKVTGSRLEGWFSDEIVLQKDSDGHIVLNKDPQVFTHVLKYLESDRTVLPDAYADLELRERVEKEIKDLGLDKGLARPDTLTS